MTKPTYSREGARQIKCLAALRMRNRDLADLFGVGLTMVVNIKSGRSWAEA